MLTIYKHSGEGNHALNMLFPACFNMPDLFAERFDTFRLLYGPPGDGNPLKLLFVG